MGTIRVATYNVNSIRSRLHIVLPWLREHRPDVFCMQETKVADDRFPVSAFAAEGYQAIFREKAGRLYHWADDRAIPAENNFAERQIRPAVILRKNSQSNRSDRGALTQAVLMSVYRTLRLRGHDPLQTISAALRSYLQTGQLPPLPAANIADG